MSEQQGAAPPTTARRLRSPAAMALADLAAIFDELQFVLRCCERLVAELAREPEPGRESVDEVVVDALWTAALTSYVRCFGPGERGMGLTADDLAATTLEGEVTQWHELLGRLRELAVEGAANPRETFSVGAAQAPGGEVTGLVITSAMRPLVDDTTVRQTGRVAYALSVLVDERITAQQETVLAAARELSDRDLGELVPIEVGVPAVRAPGGG
ncbi:hypothetical protein CFN78_14675 [Amycolatopsis antarctica]|uniref:Uncharacterized protein n=1 Tax=Amycolatopsis antarctica TaxID=1854586 RepID=A0A263D1E7_9PSEU|nr:hypothetical protein [Amycolatopsis antarctica]OZM72262.1 hypothetical protein CFN78_14675 [Amycolatopsis antarctica]